MNGTLTLVTFFPLVGVIAIFLLKPLKRETDTNIKWLAMLTSVATFAISLGVLASYDAGRSGLLGHRHPRPFLEVHHGGQRTLARLGSQSTPELPEPSLAFEHSLDLG